VDDLWQFKLFFIPANQRGLRPEMKLTSTMMMAITSRIWINPPMVELVTSPRSQRIIMTTAIVYIIEFLFQFIYLDLLWAGALPHRPTALHQWLISGLFDRDVVLNLFYSLDAPGEVASPVLLVPGINEPA
jgi:hypothetical protein